MTEGSIVKHMARQMTFLLASAWTRTTMVWVCLSVSLLSGCTLVPETRQRDTLHNPFPQMKRVAVLPFYNQSHQPNVDGEAVARSYYAALQAIPGFEVLPVGVTSTQYRAYSMQYGEPRVGADFQRLAQMMDVEAIVVGSVTDFEAYYPPRMGMTVHWYAANEGFHAIPPGYGLPWGTEAEEKIPARIVREAEFELARSQLKTQTPQRSPEASPVEQATEEVTTPDPEFAGANPLREETDPFDEEKPASEKVAAGVVRLVDHHSYQAEVAQHQVVSPIMAPSIHDGDVVWEEGSGWEGDVIVDGNVVDANGMMFEEVCGSEPFASVAPLPPAWPDPTDLIPDPPAMAPPAMIVQHDPVISHTRLYRGDDPYFTQRLADYVETGDDARGMAWQGYIKRSDDFIRFCCHLHIVEMLESRGGRDQSDLILRWPVSRY
ncbi:hypothetical protein [Rhodopirellula bahusiensis]|uniref:Uncharacterized protein n=1 Tax=Rhodopirellula bahusiensis TaxID=2014065 RepID=A0A2G1W9V0_9BACT|nr:hypothetical protein [Rhodopirellula bahusiensis]PHQ35803.1 hypothetical protein CEE69_09445 [Rhodopirellula bahusiensis]